MPSIRPLSGFVALSLLLTACSRDSEPQGTGGGSARSGAPSAGQPDTEKTVARDRVAAMVAKTTYADARRVLAPLVAGDDAAFEDLVRATVIELKDNQLESATAFLERATAKDPDAAVVHYLRGRVSELAGDDLEVAIGHYRAALLKAPDDPASKYNLASLLADLGETEEALRLCHEIEAVGIENGGAWYVSAIYQIFRTLNFEGDDEEAMRTYGDLWAALQERGYKAVDQSSLNEGELARVRPPVPAGTFPRSAVRVPQYALAETILPELAGSEELLAQDVDGDRRADVVGAGPGGIRVALRTAAGGWQAVQHVETEPARLVRTLDLFKDDSLDLCYASGGEVRLLECEGTLGEERWVRSPLALPSLPSAPADLVPVDYDHDGDLDLFLVGDFGARLWRNDGAGTARVEGQEPPPRGTFTDASEEAGLPRSGAFRWCAIEDFDGDQDVDLLAGGPGVLFVGSSLRGGKFADVAARVLPGADLPTRPLVADLDGDARVDVLAPGTPGTLWTQDKDGVLSARKLGEAVGADPREVDLDLDGTVDAVWADGAEVARGLFSAGLASAAGGGCGGTGGGSGVFAVADLESGHEKALAWELLRLSAGGVQVFRTDGPLGHGMRIRFRGKKDNRQGIGAVVELRAGELYRRHFWRGTEQVYGLGDHEYFDVVRVTWPNGVTQTELDLEYGPQVLNAGGKDLGEQGEGLIGSCPFLYTWNGERFEFVSDVLGITPLGLPMAPGMLVPPDHDEYVLVRGDQLAPDADGRLTLQFTEELREVTYLDRLRLDVVDHPVGTEVQPNERFCFPPFPEPHTHVMATPLAPVRASGSDGGDWTAALASVDDVHAVPFRPLADGQFLGLAEPHWLEVEFDRAALPAAGTLRLVCTGWFYWTDASVNVASARTPGVEFVPPILEVPEGDGWRPAGPPVGFPAGKTKTMVLDVTDVLNRADPRLRLGSTLRLYWDSIRLAVGPDGEQRTTSLEPLTARLWPRGFSAPRAGEREDLPERFDWDVLAEHPRWDQHPGQYTRYGETLPLVTEVDDRMVVMGSGDALTVRFDASALPAVPDGWTRDYLVFLDGWAKDRDPNTVEALAVEPLPFHGMSGYPYGPDEAFPSDQEHEAWRAEWQTRTRYRHIIPLSPVREREWLAEQREPALR